MTTRAPRKLWTACLPAAALGAGCAGPEPPFATLSTKSDLAQLVHQLYLQVIGVDSAILLIVVVALFLVLFRFSTRAATDTGPPKKAAENLGLEIAWTAGPAFVLLLIAIPTIRITFRTQTAAAPPGAMTVKVIAHQWWWEIRYPDLGVVTANEIHIPVDKPVRFELESADVIHSFWVPQLGGRRDVIPGHTNDVTLKPNVEGTFFGECAEFCGLSHANMGFRIVVEGQSQFDSWRQISATPAAAVAPTASGHATEGARIFSASPCTACHTVSGVSAGRIGPDLTHFGSRSMIAAAMLPNTPDNLARWLRNPSMVKPGAQMPALGLASEQTTQLVAYLESLK